MRRFGIKTKASDVSYVDAKGRRRWRKNDWAAAELKKLGEYLIIGGYEESHALRYVRLAHTISRYPESVERLHREGRLQEIPGVGETIAQMIAEYLATGSCAKKEEWAKRTPPSVLEIIGIPGLGTQTARWLYQEYGIDSLAKLEKALDDGRLDRMKGMGKKSIERIRRYIKRSPVNSK